jgi:hypothetical protein
MSVLGIWNLTESIAPFPDDNDDVDSDESGTVGRVRRAMEPK